MSVKSDSFCPNDNLDTSYIFSTHLKVVLVIRLARYCLSPLLYTLCPPHSLSALLCRAEIDVHYHPISFYYATYSIMSLTQQLNCDMP